MNSSYMITIMYELFHNVTSMSGHATSMSSSKMKKSAINFVNVCHFISQAIMSTTFICLNMWRIHGIMNYTEYCWLNIYIFYFCMNHYNCSASILAHFQCSFPLPCGEVAVFSQLAYFQLSSMELQGQSLFDFWSRDRLEFPFPY